jgi:hypothetical protein
VTHWYGSTTRMHAPHLRSHVPPSDRCFYPVMTTQPSPTGEPTPTHFLSSIFLLLPT